MTSCILFITFLFCGPVEKILSFQPCKSSTTNSCSSDHRWFSKWSTRSRKSPASQGWCMTWRPSHREPPNGSRAVDYCTFWFILVDSSSTSPFPSTVTFPPNPFSPLPRPPLGTPPCHCPTETGTFPTMAGCTVIGAKLTSLLQFGLFIWGRL